MRRRRWHPTPVLLPGKSHGQRSPVCCSPWGRSESDRTERFHFHFSPSCIGEGNDNPLQCSCLENPRDRGAWWAAVYGVAQSRTRLKRLSSSSSSTRLMTSKLISASQIPSLKTRFLYPFANSTTLHRHWIDTSKLLGPKPNSFLGCATWLMGPQFSDQDWTWTYSSESIES